MKLLPMILRMMLFLFMITACKKSSEVLSPQSFKVAPPQELTLEEKQTFHVDTTYKYEYRTGTSGNYTYNYDVSGYSINEEEVMGNISINKNKGMGTLIITSGEEVDIQVEWIGYGKLKAIDVDGNEYYLRVN